MSATWTLRQAEPAANAPAEVDISAAAAHAPDLADLLRRRGIVSAAERAAFLSPSVADLHDPLGLLGMSRAVDLLMAAREREECVAVVGDYDVDGITSTALLLGLFRAVGIRCEGILPNRHDGGYGLQPRHVAEAHRLGCRLLVTADCGILAHAAIAAAGAIDLPVIVTDHHLPGPEPLPAAAVVNPRQKECTYPFKDLAGVGLALKLAAAVLARLGREIPWPALCRIACLGTIADAAPLVGENRVLASVGLAALPATPSVGLLALMAEAEVGVPVRAYDVGFRLGPRLNAAGRLGAADPALELLLTRDPARAKELARQLGEWNVERRALERKVLDDCAERFASQPLPGILVGWSENWHRGVVGIAAGRLAREFHRPAVLFAVENGVAVGSGRSVPGLDLHGFLERWQTSCERFGGHAQAVGMTVLAANLSGLAAEWKEAATRFPEHQLAETFEYDGDLPLAEVSAERIQELARLEPFGMGNPEPVFRFSPCSVAGPPRTFGNGHLGFLVRSGAESLEVVAWGWGARQSLFQPGAGNRFEMLASLEHDNYRNRPRLRLIDARTMSPQTN
ncbi:MAG: single-stranded-DNA-specific exonuclease RecJ [Thermoanaerobaculia bacterium]